MLPLDIFNRTSLAVEGWTIAIFICHRSIHISSTSHMCRTATILGTLASMSFSRGMFFFLPFLFVEKGTNSKQEAHRSGRGRLANSLNSVMSVSSQFKCKFEEETPLYTLHQVWSTNARLLGGEKSKPLARIAVATGMQGPGQIGSRLLI